MVSCATGKMGSTAELWAGLQLNLHNLIILIRCINSKDILGICEVRNSDNQICILQKQIDSPRQQNAKDATI
jgi:hypothetical protein